MAQGEKAAGLERPMQYMDWNKGARKWRSTSGMRGKVGETGEKFAMKERERMWNRKRGTNRRRRKKPRKKEDAVVLMKAGMKCRGGVGVNGSEGGGEQVWGAEIYVWRGLLLGSRGKQPGLL